MTSRCASNIACVLLMAVAAAAWGQQPPGEAGTYPPRPIRLVVPFGSGSNADVQARTMSGRLSDALGKQVVVDNRTGAGGNIGAEVVAKAPSTGYTIMLAATSVLAINQSLYSSMPYDSVNAFAPIALMWTNRHVLIVNPSLPVKSVRELISYGKTNPGKLNFASTDIGGTVHLSGEMFKRMAGIDMVHVAYKASPLAHIDIMGGQVQVMFDSMAAALPQIKAGKVRALGVTSLQRSPLLPDVPTIAESGLPGYEAINWLAFVSTAGTPKNIIDKLNREIVRILNTREVEELLLGLGAEPAGGSGNSPEALAVFIKTETGRWGKIVKQLNLKLD